ncbi:hypothetical protein HY407_00180 [Candidatus Gottesmanbacteria bacterium]|nr:hypothetical protein [Candidatus Gottesmanbacteria bacterium]
MSKTISYLGLAGSNSYIAAQKYFKKYSLVSCNSFSSIVSKVIRGETNLGILPLENSLTGSIYETYDLLLTGNLSIVGEIFLNINHHLLVKKIFLENKLDILDLTHCYSHPEVFKQCKSFFHQYPHIKTILTEDTTRAAIKLKEDKAIATCAIGTKLGASLYHLQTLKKNIAESPYNFTRFVVVSKKGQKKGNKVSLIFSVEHVPGSLLKTLEPYPRYGLNLTKIESRPVFGKPWEYIFFVDFELKDKKDLLPKILSQMKEHVNFLKILGLYEKGEIYES